MFFSFTATATPEIYTLSLHDALPISEQACIRIGTAPEAPLRRHRGGRGRHRRSGPDRKSTRLNSSHGYISYAVFCLKKKKKNKKNTTLVYDTLYYML